MLSESLPHLPASPASHPLPVLSLLICCYTRRVKSADSTRQDCSVPTVDGFQVTAVVQFISCSHWTTAGASGGFFFSLCIPVLPLGY